MLKQLLKNSKSQLKIFMEKIKVIMNHPVFALLFICISFGIFVASIWFFHLYVEQGFLVMRNNALSADYVPGFLVTLNVLLSMVLVVGFCEFCKAAVRVFLQFRNIRRSDADVSL